MKTQHKNNERLVTKVFQDVFDKYDYDSAVYLNHNKNSF